MIDGCYGMVWCGAVYYEENRAEVQEEDLCLFFIMEGNFLLKRETFFV